MAPRRLIIVMLALLALSTALAILVPQPRTGERETNPDGGGANSTQSPPPDEAASPEGDRPGQVEGGEPGQAEGGRQTGAEEERTKGETASEGSRERAGRTVEAMVEVGGPVERIAAAPGDRLVIEVRSGKATDVVVQPVGLVDYAGPYDPARFDLLVRDSTGRLLVEELGSGRKIARIEVG